MHEEFQCDYQSGWSDFKLDVIPMKSKSDVDMVICHNDGPIYITKEQAINFFDLEEKSIDIEK